MSLFIVSYDLSAPGRDYKRVIDYLERYDCAHALESTWVIQTRKTAAAIRDEIARLIDGNDSVLVMEVAGESAWVLPVNVSDWLEQYFRAAA